MLDSAVEPVVTPSLTDLAAFSKAIRQRSLELVFAAKASHIGGALSMADLLAVLYARILKVDSARPDWDERDRFFLSKGHACSGLYATLNLLGFISDAECATYAQDGSRLTSHVSHKIPGVELSTGSLGHALSVACGVAMAGKLGGKTWRAVTLVSDGELDEGSNWEAILFAPHHQLDNLTVVVDYNKIQSMGDVKDVLALEPLAAKFAAFGWSVVEIDGHNHNQIFDALGALPREKGRPTAVIAHTIKGKGVDFMENNLLWHYRNPGEDDLRKALAQLATGS